jgi:fructoselysine-6-P-deglycase FrlB-like protein
MAEQLEERERAHLLFGNSGKSTESVAAKPTNARFIDCERKVSHGNS